MKLTQEQQDMLNGKYGEGTAYIMKIQIAIGESLDAERMVPITRAHVVLSNQEAGPWFTGKLPNTGARCRVASMVNLGFCLSLFESHNMVSPEYADSVQGAYNAYKGLSAVLSYDCTPYIGMNVPNHKKITAFPESSVMSYVNSARGTRTNREGTNNVLCAAVTSFVPEYSLLLDESREGSVLVEVQTDMRSDYDYHVLGMTGKRIGNGIPVFTGPPRHISKEALRNLGVELSTSGAYSIYHTVGFTPEVPTLEVAFGDKEPECKVIITNEDLQEELKKVSPEGNRQIDFVMFGCPHSTLEEVKYITERIKNEEFQKEMWILTSSHVKEMTVCTGLDEIIIQAGGFVASDICPDQPRWGHLDGKVGTTESSRCVYHPQRREIHFVIRDLDTCIEAALTGEVK